MLTPGFRIRKQSVHRFTESCPLFSQTRYVLLTSRWQQGRCLRQHSAQIWLYQPVLCMPQVATLVSVAHLSVSTQEATLRQQLLQLAPLMATFLQATTEQVMQAITSALIQTHKDGEGHGMNLSITHKCRYSRSAPELASAPSSSCAHTTELFVCTRPQWSHPMR